MPQRTSFWIAGISIAALAMVGCQSHVNVPVGATNDVPMDTELSLQLGKMNDEAMEIRNWDRSIAYYENPRFMAGPTGFWFEPQYYRPEWNYYFIDSPMFVMQAIAWPITWLISPPWREVQYAGETVPPTYHAMPPVPPMFSEPPVPESPMGPVREPGPMTPLPAWGELQSRPERLVTPPPEPAPTMVPVPAPTPEARPSTIPLADPPRPVIPPTVSEPYIQEPSVQRSTPVTPPATAPATRPAWQESGMRPSSSYRTTPSLTPSTQPTTYPARSSVNK